MQDEVFVLNDSGVRVLPARPMRAGRDGITLENWLQSLIANYPDLIPGKQIDPSLGDSPRFLLLRKEMPVGSWSLDHLLVDQKGVLTLVEAKLIQNTQARREVVGQIFDYAANALARWGGGQAREQATQYHAEKGQSLDDIILERFGLEDVETFWETVENNLKQGRIRLIIAGDELHADVKRVIEYLNAELRNAQIYGVELSCYGEDTGSMVLAPKLIGQTQAIADTKVTGGRRTGTWTSERLREAFAELSNSTLASRIDRMLVLAEPLPIASTGQVPLFHFRTPSGKSLMQISAEWLDLVLREQHYTGGATQRDQLLDELKQMKMLPGIIPDGRATMRLERRLEDLTDQEFDRFLTIMSQVMS